LRNKAVRSSLKTDAKKVRVALAEDDGDRTTTLLRQATRELDRATSKGVLHKRTAARRKSRLARQAAGGAQA